MDIHPEIMIRSLEKTSLLKWMPYLGIGLFLVLYLLPLGSRPLFAPDETRYGEIAREIIAADDWVVPRLNGLRYFEKPIMGHWLNAASLKVFGETPFGVRFPTAFLTGLTGLIVFCLTRRKSSVATGGLAAVIYLSFVQVYAMGTIALLDAILTFFLTAALALFFLYTEAETRGTRRRYLFLFGLFCGGAFLTKGFLALAIPVLVAVPYMVLQKRIKDLFVQLPWIPIGSALLAIAPWALLIHRAEPDFWHYFFWVEHIQRFAGASEGQHPQPFWFYLPGLMAGALPWTFLFPVFFLKDKDEKKQSERRETVFLWLWFLLPILFFSLSSGKLITYILPCFAPLAILLGKKISVSALKMSKYWSWAVFLLAAIFVLAMGGLFLLPLVPATRELSLYGPNDQNKLYLLYATLLVTVLMLTGAWKATNGKQSYWYVLAFSVPLLMVNFLLPADLLRSKAQGEFLSKYQDRVGRKSILVSPGDPLREVCWFFKRDDVYMFVAVGELRYGVSYVDAKNRLIMDHEADPPAKLDEFNAFVAKWNREGRTVIFVGREDVYKLYRELNAIPEPARIESDGKLVFAEFFP
jgi:4-amino-4-deoxy-L-arabinose transferase